MNRNDAGGPSGYTSQFHGRVRKETRPPLKFGKPYDRPPISRLAAMAGANPRRTSVAKSPPDNDPEPSTGDALMKKANGVHCPPKSTSQAYILEVGRNLAHPGWDGQSSVPAGSSRYGIYRAQLARNGGDREETRMENDRKKKKSSAEERMMELSEASRKVIEQFRKMDSRAIMTYSLDKPVQESTDDFCFVADFGQSDDEDDATETPASQLSEPEPSENLPSGLAFQQSAPPGESNSTPKFGPMAPPITAEESALSFTPAAHPEPTPSLSSAPRESPEPLNQAQTPTLAPGFGIPTPQPAESLSLFSGPTSSIFSLSPTPALTPAPAPTTAPTVPALTPTLAPNPDPTLAPTTVQGMTPTPGAPATTVQVTALAEDRAQAQTESLPSVAAMAASPFQFSAPAASFSQFQSQTQNQNQTLTPAPAAIPFSFTSGVQSPAVHSTTANPFSALYSSSLNPTLNPAPAPAPVPAPFSVPASAASSANPFASLSSPTPPWAASAAPSFGGPFNPAGTAMAFTSAPSAAASLSSGPALSSFPTPSPPPAQTFMFGASASASSAAPPLFPGVTGVFPFSSQGGGFTPGQGQGQGQVAPPMNQFTPAGAAFGSLASTPPSSVQFNVGAGEPTSRPRRILRRREKK